MDQAKRLVSQAGNPDVSGAIITSSSLVHHSSLNMILDSCYSSESEMEDELLECESMLITSNMAISTGLMALITGEMTLQSEVMALEVGKIALEAGRKVLSLAGVKDSVSPTTMTSENKRPVSRSCSRCRRNGYNNNKSDKQHRQQQTHETKSNTNMTRGNGRKVVCRTCSSRPASKSPSSPIQRIPASIPGIPPRPVPSFLSSSRPPKSTSTRRNKQITPSLVMKRRTSSDAESGYGVSSMGEDVPSDTPSEKRQRLNRKRHANNGLARARSLGTPATDGGRKRTKATDTDDSDAASLANLQTNYDLRSREEVGTSEQDEPLVHDNRRDILQALESNDSMNLQLEDDPFKNIQLGKPNDSYHVRHSITTEASEATEEQTGLDTVSMSETDPEVDFKPRFKRLKNKRTKSEDDSEEYVASDNKSFNESEGMQSKAESLLDQSVAENVTERPPSVKPRSRSRSKSKVASSDDELLKNLIVNQEIPQVLSREQEAEAEVILSGKEEPRDGDASQQDVSVAEQKLQAFQTDEPSQPPKVKPRSRSSSKSKVTTSSQIELLKEQVMSKKSLEEPKVEQVSPDENLNSMHEDTVAVVENETQNHNKDHPPKIKARSRSRSKSKHSKEETSTDADNSAAKTSANLEANRDLSSEQEVRSSKSDEKALMQDDQNDIQALESNDPMNLKPLQEVESRKANESHPVEHSISTEARIESEQEASTSEAKLDIQPQFKVDKENKEHVSSNKSLLQPEEKPRDQSESLLDQSVAEKENVAEEPPKLKPRSRSRSKSKNVSEDTTATVDKVTVDEPKDSDAASLPNLERKEEPKSVEKPKSKKKEKKDKKSSVHDNQRETVQTESNDSKNLQPKEEVAFQNTQSSENNESCPVRDSITNKEPETKNREGEEKRGVDAVLVSETDPQLDLKERSNTTKNLSANIEDKNVSSKKLLVDEVKKQENESNSSLVKPEQSVSVPETSTELPPSVKPRSRSRPKTKTVTSNDDERMKRETLSPQISDDSKTNLKTREVVSLDKEADDEVERKCVKQEVDCSHIIKKHDVDRSPLSSHCSKYVRRPFLPLVTSYSRPSVSCSPPRTKRNEERKITDLSSSSLHRRYRSLLPISSSSLRVSCSLHDAAVTTSLSSLLFKRREESSLKQKERDRVGQYFSSTSSLNNIKSSKDRVVYHQSRRDVFDQQLKRMKRRQEEEEMEAARERRRLHTKKLLDEISDISERLKLRREERLSQRQRNHPDSCVCLDCRCFRSSSQENNRQRKPSALNYYHKSHCSSFLLNSLDASFPDLLSVPSHANTAVETFRSFNGRKALVRNESQAKDEKTFSTVIKSKGSIGLNRGSSEPPVSQTTSVSPDACITTDESVKGKREGFASEPSSTMIPLWARLHLSSMQVHPYVTPSVSVKKNVRSSLSSDPYFPSNPGTSFRRSLRTSSTSYSTRFNFASRSLSREPKSPVIEKKDLKTTSVVNSSYSLRLRLHMTSEQANPYVTPSLKRNVLRSLSSDPYFPCNRRDK